MFGVVVVIPQLEVRVDNTITSHKSNKAKT